MKSVINVFSSCFVPPQDHFFAKANGEPVCRSSVNEMFEVLKSFHPQEEIGPATIVQSIITETLETETTDDAFLRINTTTVEKYTDDALLRINTTTVEKYKEALECSRSNAYRPEDRTVAISNCWSKIFPQRFIDRNIVSHEENTI